MARKLGLCVITALTQPFEGHGTHEDASVIPIRDPEMDKVGTREGERHRVGSQEVMDQVGYQGLRWTAPSYPMPPLGAARYALVPTLIPTLLFRHQSQSHGLPSVHYEYPGPPTPSIIDPDPHTAYTEAQCLGPKSLSRTPLGCTSTLPDPRPSSQAYAEARRLGLKSVSEEDGSDAAALALRLEKEDKEEAKAQAEREREKKVTAASIGSAVTAKEAAASSRSGANRPASGPSVPPMSPLGAAAKKLCTNAAKAAAAVLKRAIGGGRA